MANYLLLTFLKNWTLPLAIVAGIIAYFTYTAIPALNTPGIRHAVMSTLNVAQLMLIFAMLFITFCKISIRDLRLTRWHAPLLLLQTLSFIVGAWILTTMGNPQHALILESFMLCLICPTATAAVVVTAKLGGNTGTLATYTILINLAVAIIVPLIVPLIHPELHTASADASFFSSFLVIIMKVFPLLMGPLILALITRRVCPRVARAIASVPDLAFYLWAVSLAMAIAVSVKALMSSHIQPPVIAAIAGVSALACVLQFAFGRFMGRRYGEPVSAAQACGQKNIILGIWIGYTFLNPVTALAGGFYSIWHNIYNSWQLRQQRLRHPTTH